MLYIHGFLVDTRASYNKVVINAYQSRQDHNVIALDWSVGPKPSYFNDSIPHMEKTGTLVAEVLMQMSVAGLDLDKLHIVGHSLGAQMAGLIGRIIKQSMHGKLVIKRISGLDPAYPGFYGEEIQGLSSADAEFVDIIHTDGGFLGVPGSIGTADFFPNGGNAPQPGCWKTPVIVHVCSHARAWFLWAESVANKNPQKFLAVRAKSWDDFKINKIEETNSNFIMGINCPPGISGEFYLQTNSKAPFARGEDGTRYIPSIFKEDEEMDTTSWLIERKMVILEDKKLVRYWKELTEYGTSGVIQHKATSTNRQGWII
ncbi:lipase member H-B-like isoform X2 [Hermetia illucens]|nr:lipase member H-B-like isoform X2 [Hermetia illucens]